MKTDADLKKDVIAELAWDPAVDSTAIGVARLTVDHGWVTLQGDLEWDYQRRGVVKALRPSMGVVGISNEITLRAKVKADNLSHKIQEALTRQAKRQGRHIQVDVDGTTVKLSGTVHSWQERDAAQGVAWSAPGVGLVVNELRVG